MHRKHVVWSGGPITDTCRSCDKQKKTWYLNEFIFCVMKRYKCIVNYIWMAGPVAVLRSDNKIVSWPNGVGIDFENVARNWLIWDQKTTDYQFDSLINGRFGRSVGYLVGARDLHLQFFEFWALGDGNVALGSCECPPRVCLPYHTRDDFQPRTI